MSGPRPARLVVVFGTATDVGKTWVSCGLLTAARAAGWSVAARKPAQSYDAGAADGGTDGGGRTDADLLAAATGESPQEVCPPHRWYPLPLAPPMAAQTLGRPPIALADLVTEIAWPARAGGPGGDAVGSREDDAVRVAGGRRGPRPAVPPSPSPALPGVDLGLVETAGGPRSPLAGDGDGVALAAALGADAAVLVADAGLGTINAVRLSVGAIAAAGIGRVVVVLNRFDPADPLHGANAGWLRDVDALTVVTDPTAALAHLPAA